jgi:hypothetical protein
MLFASFTGSLGDPYQRSAAVLKMRGAERLRKPLEVHLFVQATSILTTRCMRAGIAPPEYLFDLAQTASKNMGANEPGWRIFHLQMLLARFRAHISQGVIADLHLILKEALRLDGLCSSISLEGNPIWDFETIHSDLDSDLIMFGHYHVYPNFMAAQVWNGIRTARLALHDIIRKTLLKGFTSQPQSSIWNIPHNSKYRQTRCFNYNEMFSPASLSIWASKIRTTQRLKKTPHPNRLPSRQNSRGQTSRVVSITPLRPLPLCPMVFH